MWKWCRSCGTVTSDNSCDCTYGGGDLAKQQQLIPNELDACELCGAGINHQTTIHHQTAPVERWLCAGCGQREEGASSNYRSIILPGDM